MIIIPEYWIKKPNEENIGFLEAFAENDDVSFPIPVETHNVSIEDVTLNKEQDFDFVIEGDSDICVYADEDDYYRKNGKGLASESFIPAGLFSPTNDEKFIQTPRAVINGRITDTYDDPTKFGFGSEDVIFTMNCLGFEFDGVIHDCPKNIADLKVGNYISGMFWIQGWPKEEFEN